MPVPYDQDTSAFRARVDEDVMKWWDTLQQNKPVLEKRQIQVSQQTLESSPIAFARDVVVPQGGGGAGGTATYNCVDDECVDPGDGSGTYATLAECEAECGCEDSEFSNLTVEATLSGNFFATGGCAADSEVTISGHALPVDAIGCVSSNCTDLAVITATCPEGCVDDGSGTFDVCVAVFVGGSGNWVFGFSADFSTGVCGSNFPTGIGGSVAQVDSGSSTKPSGTYTFSFDDGDVSTVHYDVTVIVTP